MYGNSNYIIWCITYFFPSLQFQKQNPNLICESWLLKFRQNLFEFSYLKDLNLVIVYEFDG